MGGGLEGGRAEEWSTLKISRLVPPELWVARVGGGLHLADRAAFESCCMCLGAMVLDGQEVLSRTCITYCLLETSHRADSWTSANRLSRWIN